MQGFIDYTTRERLTELLNKHRSSSLSEEEYEELFRWFDMLDISGKTFADWSEERGGDDFVSDRLYQTFLNYKDRSRSPWRPYLVQIAASVLLLCGVFWISYRYTINSVPRKPHITQYTNVGHPGTNKAELTLANGKTIYIQSIDKKREIDLGDNLIAGLSSGIIDLRAIKTQDKKLIKNSVLTLVKVPRGGQFEVFLPDGTHVWLNSDTQLKFPLVFSGVNREVEIIGEAYFEVTHNMKQPFIVKSGNMEIKVLGTHFNVRNYSEEQRPSTSLVEGCVQIKNIHEAVQTTLLPGYSGILLQTGHVRTEKANIDQILSWKYGQFVFDNEPLSVILSGLGRWYDVDCHYSESLGNEKFGGTFSKSSDLMNILTSLEELGDVQFEVKGKEVFVTKRKR
ncbi:MAG: DUF4974 domain-containing protein [Mucilaginibacter polytrichastri]|nr:DUF4974 domain-containing protein [Mucilaginibacter polytrichastri]